MSAYLCIECRHHKLDRLVDSHDGGEYSEHRCYAMIGRVNPVSGGAISQPSACDNMRASGYCGPEAKMWTAGK